LALKINATATANTTRRHTTARGVILGMTFLARIAESLSVAEASCFWIRSPMIDITAPIAAESATPMFCQNAFIHALLPDHRHFADRYGNSTYPQGVSGRRGKLRGTGRAKAN